MSPAATAPQLNQYSDELRELLDQHMPKPGQILIFRLIHNVQPLTAIGEENQTLQLEGRPARYRMLPRETIIDPGTNRPLTIANVRDWQHTGPNNVLTPVLGELEFLGVNQGQLYASADDPMLCERLLLSDKNKDSINPRRRTPEHGHKFELVKPEVTAEETYKRLMKIATASTSVAALDAEQVRAIAEKLSLPTLDRGRELTEQELRLKLLGVAQAEPERIESLLESGENKLEQLIGKAEKLGLVDFVEEAQQWRWKATQEPICEAVMGYKPQEAVIRYIQSNANGPRFSQMLAGRVKSEEDKAKKK